jgi:hypothetical protein
LTAGLEVINYLRFLNAADMSQRLQFHYDAIEANEIRPIETSQSDIFVKYWKFYLSLKWDFTLKEFDGQCLLVYQL